MNCPKSYKVLIVEDDISTADELKFIIDNTDNWELVGITDSYLSSKRIIDNNHLDLVILDIRLGDEGDGGIKVAEYIRKLPERKQMLFFFTSDYFGVESIEARAIATLPEQTISKTEILHNENVLKRTMKLMQAKIDERKSTPPPIIINIGTNLPLLLHEIIWIEKHTGTKYVHIQTVNKQQSIGNSYRVMSSLSGILKKLNDLDPHNSFLQISQNVAVNFSWVEEVNLKTSQISFDPKFSGIQFNNPPYFSKKLPMSMVFQDAHRDPIIEYCQKRGIPLIR